MIVDIKNCDINNDYFHFSNRKNVDSILNNGLIPSIGESSQLVGDRPNVSVSKGGKGIIGIINSFIYKFSNELKVAQIPNGYRKYFQEISNFETNNVISKELVYKAMIRKLKDEVYFRVTLDKECIEKAKIGGLTGYDINLPMKIDKSRLEILTDSNKKVLTAYDVAKYVYEKAKNIEVLRKMHGGFFEMFEMGEQNISMKPVFEDSER